jgi:transcriptional regulator GlxA family with amidase domain
MHTVAVLAMEGVVAFDLATPVNTFGFTQLACDRPAYEVVVCGAGPVSSETFTIQPHHGLDALTRADTVIVPGCVDTDSEPPAEVLTALRAAAANGARMASICVGAFTLAATGLLNGLRATTHWLGASALAERYPEVEVDPNVLYVDNGQVLTSAGAAAGLDMCLHMIRRDFGSAVAANVARLSVMPLEREGGQAQCIVHDQPPVPRGAELEPLLRWLSDNTATDLTLADIAAHAGMSTRTLNRRFREQTGTTPLQWLHRERVRRAQYLLENTTHPVDRIANEVGFGSPTAFRERFKRVVGTSPHAYRAAFQS